MKLTLPITFQGALNPDMTDIYEKIYNDLEHIGVLGVKEYAVIQNDPDPPLFIDRLGPDTFALAHNRIENGQVIIDTDMEIKVHAGRRIAEPLTFQDDTIRKVVYPEPGKVDLRVKNELTAYLARWLTSLVNKGYRYE
jgi:hypothetical protein